MQLSKEQIEYMKHNDWTVKIRQMDLTPQQKSRKIAQLGKQFCFQLVGLKIKG